MQTNTAGKSIFAPIFLLLVILLVSSLFLFRFSTENTNQTDSNESVLNGSEDGISGLFVASPDAKSVSVLTAESLPSDLKSLIVPGASSIKIQKFSYTNNRKDEYEINYSLNNDITKSFKLFTAPLPSGFTLVNSVVSTYSSMIELNNTSFNVTINLITSSSTSKIVDVKIRAINL